MTKEKKPISVRTRFNDTFILTDRYLQEVVQKHRTHVVVFRRTTRKAVRAIFRSKAPRVVSVQCLPLSVPNAPARYMEMFYGSLDDNSLWIGCKHFGPVSTKKIKKWALAA